MNSKTLLVTSAAAVIAALCAFPLLGAEPVEPLVAAEWTYCSGLDMEADEWGIQTPSESAFEIELVDGALRFRGTADAPEFAPQAVLSQTQTMGTVLEVVVLVDVGELGGTFALDVDDAAGRYNWSLDVSASLISFGYADTTCGCGSGWSLLNQSDSDSWTMDSMEGEHVLRVAFERRAVRAYVDRMRIASFGLPEDLDKGIIRLSVGPSPLPEGDSGAIESTDVRVMQVCVGEQR